LQISDGVSLFWGAKYRWGIKISQFSTNNSLYLVNDTRWCHSYRRSQIGNGTRAFEWYHFQSSSSSHMHVMNPNWSVSVTLSYRQPRFQVTIYIYMSMSTRKWYKIQL